MRFGSVVVNGSLAITFKMSVVVDLERLAVTNTGPAKSSARMELDTVAAPSPSCCVICPAFSRSLPFTVPLKVPAVLPNLNGVFKLIDNVFALLASMESSSFLTRSVSGCA